MKEEKLRQAFVEALGIPADKVTDDLRFSSVKQWDSVAHMVLVVAIEETFDILMETEDVINMSSFLRAKEILSKYGIKD